MTVQTQDMIRQLKGMRTRCQTAAAMLQSTINGTDADSMEGKRVRLMHRELTRQVEILDEMFEELVNIRAAALHGEEDRR